MVLDWAAQVLGKTEIMTTLIGWCIECGPGGGMMYVLPTIKMAEAWSKLKLAPLLVDLERDTGDQPFTQKGATAESTVGLKVWANGFLVIGGANSAGPLSSYTVRILFLDEPDRYPPTVATRGNVEGDPISVVARRTETFPDGFQIEASTPTTKNMSRIEADLEETDCRKWHVKCLKCKRLWVIMFNDIKWPKGPGGEHDHSRIDEAYLECPHCHNHFTDAQRQAMVRAGKWIPTNPKVKNKPGFWANAFITLLRCKRRYKNRLHQWADEFLEAKHKGTDTLRAFTNQVMTESFEEPAEKPEAPEILFNRREHYFEGAEPTLPPGALVLTVGADKQKDRIEAELVAWGAGEESWSVDYRVFPGDFEDKDFRETVGAWLTEKYRLDRSETELEVAAACFDSGDKPESVYKFVKEMSPKAVWSVKGYGSFDLPWINRSKAIRRHVNLNVDVAKATLYSRLSAVSKPGPGYCHFPWDRDLKWFQQLVSERLVSYTRQGIVYKRFELQGGATNEALDCRVYAYAGLGLLGRVNWKALARRLGVPVPAEGKDSGGSEKNDPGLNAEAGGPIPAAEQDPSRTGRRQSRRRLRIRPVWGNFKWSKW